MKTINMLLHPVVTFVVLFLAILSSAIIFSETTMKIFIVLGIGVVWGYFSHRAHEEFKWGGLNINRFQVSAGCEDGRTRLFVLSLLEQLATGDKIGDMSALARAMSLMSRHNTVERISVHEATINLEQLFAAGNELGAEREDVCHLLMLSHDELVGKCYFTEPGSGLIRPCMSDENEMSKFFDLILQKQRLYVCA